MIPSRLMSLILLSSMLLNACAPIPEGESHRQLILGFGWIDTVRSKPIDANSVTALGIFIGREGLQAGLIQSHRTSIDPAKAGDALVKVESSPLKLSVTARSIESQSEHP